AYNHTSGDTENEIRLRLKTSASLIVNNILERGQTAINVAGASGNVIAYNYVVGSLDQHTPNLLVGPVYLHWPHPEFNLFEGNLFPQFWADNIHGSSASNTVFRNWITGTSRVCQPWSGRGTVDCSGANGTYAYQAGRAIAGDGQAI